MTKRSLKYSMLLMVVLSCFGNSLKAQQKMKESQVAAHQEQIKNYFSKQEFSLALPLLVELHDDNPTDKDLNYTLGYCYVMLDDEKALPYLEYCLKTPKDFPKELYYYSARAYHLEYKFEKAIELYEKYKETFKKPKKHQAKIDEIVHELKLCRNGIDMMKMDTNVEVFSISTDINTEFPEYSPIFDADQNFMIFTSCRPDTKGGKIDPFDGRYYEDIYISYREGEKWTQPLNMGAPINTENNDAVVALSPDGQKMYFYRYSHGHGDLYVSEFDGLSWGEPEKLPEPINTHNWEPSMSITPDENIIYFSSDRPGGFGGTDIYSVKKLPNGQWAQPQNLGPEINTKYDEDSPFIHPDGKTLYFSSNSDKSMGGFDVFISEFDEADKKWKEPKNMGMPVSTTHDDLYFSISADGTTMYFSSIRPEGKGDKDIYYAKLKKTAANIMMVKGVVIDGETKQPVFAHIEVKDKETGELVGVYNTNKQTGNYTILFNEGNEYHIEISAEGYGSHIDDLKIPTLQEFTAITRNFKLMPNTSQIQE